MNIETKIAELDALIAERTKTSDILYADMEAKRQHFEDARHAWAEFYREIEQLKQKREVMLEMLKDCGDVISRCLPPDEDIGRTVSFMGGINEQGNVIPVKSRIPIFKGNQEREFIEPK